jgi:hypothetical protein
MSFNTVQKWYVDWIVVVDHDYVWENIHHLFLMNLMYHCSWLRQRQQLRGVEQSEKTEIK